jgi:SAM-dependent methyltransferase
MNPPDEKPEPARSQASKPVIQVVQWEEAEVAQTLSGDWESRRHRHRWSNERHRMSQLLRNNLVKGESVLDVGCGPGFYVPVYLECCGPSGTTLVDQSAQMLVHCRRTHPMLLAEHLVQGSIFKIPLPDGQFDAVVNCDVLMHIPHYRQALGELYRVCRPEGGRVFLRVNLTDGPTYGDLPSPEHPDPEKIYWIAYGREEFKRSLEALGPSDITVIDRICRKPLKRGGDSFMADAAIVVLTRGKPRRALKMETRLGHLFRKLFTAESASRA